MKRFDVLALLLDQVRYLRHTSDKKPAWIARFVVFLVAPILFFVSMALRWKMHAVGEFVGALGLLAGVFISAFAIVFSLRLGLGRRPVTSLKLKQAYSMDEAALTLLAAGLLAGVDAVYFAVVSAVTPDGEAVGVWLTAIGVALSGQVVLYFLMSIRRLHVLYIESFPPYWSVAKLVKGSESSRTTVTR